MEAFMPDLRARIFWAALILPMVAAPMAEAQVVFTDIGVSKGIGPYVMPVGPVGGVVAADYDNDGFVDVFVPNAVGAADQLYHNLGNGSFEEVAAAVASIHWRTIARPSGSITTAIIGSIWSSAATAVPNRLPPIPAPIP